MTVLSRADDSLIADWWWTVDRWLLLALALLLAAGVILAFGASTPKAEDLGLPPFYFVKRQGVYLLLAAAVMIGISLLAPKTIRRGGILLCLLALAMTAVTLFVGPEFNGARRWLSVAGMTVQPSELLKPAFVITSAWLLAGAMEDRQFPGRRLSAALWALSVCLLAFQPDVGQAVLVSMVWGAQLMLSGAGAVWIAALGSFAILGAAAAYVLLPHVSARIDAFLAPGGAGYQVETALNALRAGGLFGRGPGEGAVKKVLPDAHTDYIFAVAGEEFGSLACLGILALFAVIVLRGLARLAEETDPFVLLAVGGMLALVGLQALFNVAVNLALLPPKGMTLPFISYGGSSMVALGAGMGAVLALTRRNRREMDGFAGVEGRPWPA